MSATILQFETTNETDKQVDSYIIDRLEVILSTINGRVNFAGSEELLDIEEACAFLKNCSEGTLNSYTKSGLKKHKKGQKVFFLRKEILEFIASWPAD